MINLKNFFILCWFFCQNSAREFAKNSYFYLLTTSSKSNFKWYTIMTFYNASQLIMNKISFDRLGQAIEDYNMHGYKIVMLKNICHCTLQKYHWCFFRLLLWVLSIVGMKLWLPHYHGCLSLVIQIVMKMDDDALIGDYL